MELLKRLTQTDGVSGDESEIRAVIENEIKEYCDEVFTDAMGNLIAHINGGGKKVMFDAHMDEIGIVVTYIDENGFIRFRNIGGLYVRHLVGRRVRFKNGTVGVIGCEEEEFNKKPMLEKLYIDIGADNCANASETVSAGDTAVFAGEINITKNTVVSKALDDRAGCYILIKTIQNIKNSKNDLYFVFSSQEEIGLRGAKTAAFAINPDFAVAVDVTDTGDVPSASAMVVKKGKGAAVKIMDRSVICDADVRIKLIETAKTHGIPYQLEIMTEGGTNAGAIHLTRAGIKTGAVSLPARYIHSPSEMIDIKDLENCCSLIKAAAETEW